MKFMDSINIIDLTYTKVEWESDGVGRRSVGSGSGRKIPAPGNARRTEREEASWRI